MQNWPDNVLRLIAEIDRCIHAREGETLTLAHLARLLDCSQSQVSHKFRALTGTSLRDFVQARRPALALPAVRDGEQRLLSPEAEQQMAFVNEPSGRRLLSGYRTRSCVLFYARLCAFLEVYPACCSILKKQLKFFLDGDTVI